MAFSYTNSKGKTYILHHKQTTLKNGSQRRSTSLQRKPKKALWMLSLRL